MATRYLLPLAVIFTFLPVNAQELFEGAADFDGSTLKGKPKLVRVELESPIGQDAHALVEETEYRPDGKTSWSKHYNQGKLQSHQAFAYDANGLLLHSVTYNAEGNVVTRSRIVRLGNREEEEIVTRDDGEEERRIWKRRDQKDRVTLLRMTEHSGGEVTEIAQEYDEQGRPREARLRMIGGQAFVPVSGSGAAARPVTNMSIRLSFLYPAERQVIFSVYDEENQLLTQEQMQSDTVGNHMGQSLFSPAGTPPQPTAGVVEASDAQGNWIRKAQYKRDAATQADAIDSRQHRTITYY